MTLTTLQLSEPYGQVACRDRGQGAPLVLIHGVGMQSAAWGPQIEAFSRSHRVLALDMPGHGGSAPLAGQPELPDYVAWLAAVIETLGCGPVNLAGHSMGALIAGGFAVAYPQMVSRLALLNGVYCRDAAARAAVASRATDIRAGRIDLETPLKRWFGDAPRDQVARAQVAGWLEAVDPAGYGAAYDAFAGGDATYAGGYTAITCPFLALTGALDPNSTPAMSQAMAQAAQRGRAVVIEGQRHMVNLTASARVNAALAEWLRVPLERKETA